MSNLTLPLTVARLNKTEADDLRREHVLMPATGNGSASATDRMSAYLKAHRNLTPHVSRPFAFSTAGSSLGTNQHAGAIWSNNSFGDVVLVPHAASNVRCYRTSTGAVVTLAAHGEGASAFAAGCYSRDTGLCIFAPHGSSYVGRYNAETGTYQRGAAHGEGALAFSGACTINDGRVIFAPYGSSYVGIYDPRTDIYTRGPAHGLVGVNPTECAVQAPNGLVVFSPLGSSTVGVYNPATNLMVTGPTHGEGGLAFQGCVLMPNGKICLIPFNCNYVGIYDPVANTYTRGPDLTTVITPGTLDFCGGTLMADGRVVMFPREADNFVYYDYLTNTLQLGPAHALGANAFVGGCLAPGGLIVAAPFTGGSVGLLNTYMTPADDEAFCLHESWNHY